MKTDTAIDLVKICQNGERAQVGNGEWSQVGNGVVWKTKVLNLQTIQFVIFFYKVRQSTA